jgi:hypothetical protein
MNSKEILRVEKEKDLGVCVSANFNWDVHIHTRCSGYLNEHALFWETKQYDERCISRLLDLSYVTLVKSGLHTLSNSDLESNASKEEPPRGYYNLSMAKW